MITADQALQLILENSGPGKVSRKPLLEAVGSYLSEDLASPIDLPPFDNAAMDGFAVRSVDLEKASDRQPLSLSISGCIAAGDHFQTPLKKGACFRIMTGAPVPRDSDAVVPFEETRFDERDAIFSQTVVVGSHIRKTGEDVRNGEILCRRGDKISSRVISLLAAVGYATLPVFEKPRIGILSTGSELVEPGHPLSPGKIYNSNAPSLLAALKEMGLEGHILGSVCDEPQAMGNLLQKTVQSKNYDVLFTMGGVSAGDFDWIPQVLSNIGARIVFHKTAIKPGKPLLYAVHEGAETLQIFGLPGNPVSSLMVFDRFVRPALLKRMGVSKSDEERVMAQATVKGRLKGSQGKVDFLRGVVRWEEGRFVAESAGAQGSARLTTLSRANAVLILPESVSELRDGETVDFEKW